MINYLTDIVLPNEKSICVFVTHQQFLNNLDLNDKNQSKSGIWKLDSTKMIGVKKVVIYYRHSDVNEIIIGKYINISESGVSNRYFLHFQILGWDTTRNNWKIFCKTGSNPIRYFP